MTMTTQPWMDFNFWFFGPLSIWFLGGVLLFCAVVCLINTKRMMLELHGGTVELQRITTEMRKDNAQLRDATALLNRELEKVRRSTEQSITELRTDTTQLTNATARLNEELGMTRQSVDGFRVTLKRLYSYWFPWSSDNNNNDDER